MTTILVNRLEEFAFLLENGADVDARDILHALAPELSKPLAYGPQGSTQADAWMANHGNPLYRTEAALALGWLVEPGMDFEAGVTATGAKVQAWAYEAKGGAVTATAATLAAAIVAAVCLYQLEQERT